MPTANDILDWLTQPRILIIASCWLAIAVVAAVRLGVLWDEWRLERRHRRRDYDD